MILGSTTLPLWDWDYFRSSAPYSSLSPCRPCTVPILLVIVLYAQLVRFIGGGPLSLYFHNDLDLVLRNIWAFLGVPSGLSIFEGPRTTRLRMRKRLIINPLSIYLASTHLSLNPLPPMNSVAPNHYSPADSGMSRHAPAHEMDRVISSTWHVLEQVSLLQCSRL